MNLPCDDKCSLDQIYGFFNGMYVDREELTNPNDGTISPYTLEHVPVLKATIVGEIFYKNELIQKFTDFSCGLNFQLAPKKKKSKFPGHWTSAFPSVVSGEIDYKQGNIKFKWNRPIQAGDSKVVISYEYAR